MKHILAVALILLSATTAFARCAGKDLTDSIRAADPATYAEIAARAAAVPNGEGVLWRVTRDDLPPSYLFGTYHLDQVANLPVAQHAETLAARARLMFVEISEAEQEEMATAFHANPGMIVNDRAVPLSDWLEPSLLTAAEALLPRYGLNMPTASLIQPWMLNLMIALPPCMIAAQQNGMLSMDHELARAAESAGVPVQGVETWQEQISIFADAPLEDQRDGLRLSLASPHDPEDMQATMAALYAKGEVMMLWELSLAAARDLVTDRDIDAVAAEWWDVVATRRNAVMAERALPDFAEGGVFMAVGALHLPGEAGLVELLRAEGFKVEQVKL